MDDSAAMGFRHSGAELAGDFQGFWGSEFAVGGQVRPQSLAFEKLHGEEINFPVISVGGKDVIHHADIGVAHFQCAF